MRTLLTMAILASSLPMAACWGSECDDAETCSGVPVPVIQDGGPG